MLGKHLNHCEDSLTASVFTHLLHLPAEVFWTILRNACYSHDLPAHAGEPQLLEFQPKWNSSGAGNKKYVEPDVFLRFRDFDLIIEAKRGENSWQDPAQWQRELIGYTNVYGEEKRQVRMIALGGILQEWDDMLSHSWHPSLESEPHQFACPVHMCRWEGIVYQCSRMLGELQRLNYPNSQTFAMLRILEDMIRLFACHNIFTRQWFADFSFDRHILSSNIDLHLQLFQTLGQQFSRP